MRFKKNIFFVMVLAPISAYSLDLVKSQKPFTGLYFGGRLGGSLLGGSFSYENTNDKGSFTFNGSGLTFGGMAGYMFLTSTKMFFAGELYIERKTSSADAVMNNNSNLGNVTLSSKQSLGAAGLIGSAVSPRLVVYAKVGYEKADFSFNYSKLKTQPATISSTKTANIFVPGTGGFYKLSKDLVVGADYTISSASVALMPNVNDLSVAYIPSEHRGCVTVRFIF